MADVNPLHEIEAILGCVETWPSEIVKKNFIEDYDRQNVFKVISFFYGNNVPVSKALTFYTKCKIIIRFWLYATSL